MTRHVVALGAIGLAIGLPCAGLAGEAAVEFEHGLVTATFDAVPAAEVFDAIRGATRANLVVEPALEGKVVTLTVTRVSFDLFLQRVLHALGWGDYAVVYEPDGGPGRLVIVDPGRGDRRPPASRPDGDRAAPGVPVYVPPRAPPVYIPPRDPAPTYVPPTRLPVVKRPDRVPLRAEPPASGATEPERAPDD